MDRCLQFFRGKRWSPESLCSGRAPPGHSRWKWRGWKDSLSVHPASFEGASSRRISDLSRGPASGVNFAAPDRHETAGQNSPTPGRSSGDCVSTGGATSPWKRSGRAWRGRFRRHAEPMAFHSPGYAGTRRTNCAPPAIGKNVRVVTT